MSPKTITCATTHGFEPGMCIAVDGSSADGVFVVASVTSTSMSLRPVTWRDRLRWWWEDARAWLVEVYWKVRARFHAEDV